MHESEKWKWSRSVVSELKEMQNYAKRSDEAAAYDASIHLLLNIMPLKKKSASN